MLEVFIAHQCHSKVDVGFNPRDKQLIADTLARGNTEFLTHYRVDFMQTVSSHGLDKELILLALLNMGASVSYIDQVFEEILEKFVKKLSS